MPTQQKDPVQKPDNETKPQQSTPSAWERKSSKLKKQAEFRCAMVRREMKLRGKLHELVRWARRRPESGQLGEFFYRIGLAGEYTVLRTGQELRRVALIAGRRAGHLGRLLWNKIRHTASGIWEDITAPCIQFAVGLHNLRTFVREEREHKSTASAAKSGAGYFWRGMLRYAPLARRAFAYVAPLLALGVFAYTVHTVLNYNYVLAVEVGGDVVGYVQSERVFDDAKTDLSQRIKDAEGSGQEWDIVPRYTIAVSDEIMTESAMVDAILSHSSDKIQNATALYVDGRLAAVTTEGDRLREELQAMLDAYAIPDKPEVVPEFTQQVGTVDGVYFTDSIDDYDDISALLHGEVQGEVYDQVREGDSPSQLASRNDLTTQQLYDMNGGVDAVNSKMYPGEQLLIRQKVKFLTVQTIETITATRPIPYQTVEEKTDEMSFGKRKVVQEGVEGVEEYTINRYTREGVTWDEEIESHVVQEPVTEKVQVGTKLASGMIANTGSGSFMWPVPNYTYVSRWMSPWHKGADICARYGTPIVASDSGVVVTATYHYSYGNYVVIDHGNGYRTLYAHASQLLVSVGQAVEQGQTIALVGSTGNSTGNHCHFEMFRNGVRFSAQTIFGGM